MTPSLTTGPKVIDSCFDQHRCLPYTRVRELELLEKLINKLADVREDIAIALSKSVINSSTQLMKI